MSNVKNDRDLTALHYASQNGYTEAVQLLIDNNADVNAKESLWFDASS